MSKELDTLDVIEDSKEALVEVAEEQDSNVVKVIIGVGLVGLAIAGLGYAGYKYVQKKKAAAEDEVFEDEFPE